MKPTSVPQITGNPMFDAMLLKGIVLVIGLAVPWLMAHLKLTDPDYALWLSATLFSVLVGAATFVWGWLLTKVNLARGVQAGVNLTASGHALAADGSVITQFQAANDVSATPPKPVTVASAQEIMNDFAPATVPKGA